MITDRPLTNLTDKKGNALLARFFEANNDLTGLGVAEIGAGHALDGLGIRTSGVKRSLERAAQFFLRFDLRLVLKQLLAHALVLANERQIPEADCEYPEQQETKHGKFCQLIPDASGVH